MSRSVGIAVGALLVVFGAIFTLQGVGVIGGSVMTGVTLWAVLGPIIALAGVALIVVAVRKGRRE